MTLSLQELLEAQRNLAHVESFYSSENMEGGGPVRGVSGRGSSMFGDSSYLPSYLSSGSGNTTIIVEVSGNNVGSDKELADEIVSGMRGSNWLTVAPFA